MFIFQKPIGGVAVLPTGKKDDKNKAPQNGKFIYPTQCSERQMRLEFFRFASSADIPKKDYFKYICRRIYISYRCLFYFKMNKHFQNK